MKDGPHIHVHIVELVLNGVEPGERHRLADALQGELLRLLAENGAPEGLTASRSIDTLELGPIPVRPGRTAAPLGRHIAQTLYQGMNPAPAEGRAR